ncbi:MAG: hypothetical protein U0P30_07225 [Vicinamibacterales bacterium]
MTRFALLRNIDALPTLMHGLDAWARSRSPYAAPPRPLDGLWIAHPDDAAPRGDALHALDRGPARLRLQMGPGPWSLCVTATPLSRLELVDALRSALAPGGATRARFVPVYRLAGRDDLAADWQRLAAHHGGLILPPMGCDEDGRLRFLDPEVLAPVVAPRLKGLESWLPGLA